MPPKRKSMSFRQKRSRTLSPRKRRSRSLQPSKRPKIQEDIELNNVHKYRNKLKNYEDVINQYSSNECDKLLKLFEIIHQIQINKNNIDKLTYVTGKIWK